MKKILIVEGNLPKENKNFQNSGIQTHADSLKESLSYYSKDLNIDVFNPCEEKTFDKIIPNIILKILGRDKELFLQDYKHSQEYLKNIISNSKIIVLGGAGSIGSSVVLELLKYNPFLLHIVDIDENNLVELVRNIRSSKVYNQSKFETFAIDISSSIFEKLVIDNNGYDIWMNFSAFKHVRSEKDVYTLMRLIEVNVINTFTTINLANQILKSF